MPYLNRSVRSYENQIYHLYARGVNKCLIYKDASDKKFFLYLLKKYLQKDFLELRNINNQSVYVPPNSVYESVELQAYCLMDNHFHMLVYCKQNGGVERLMRRVLSVYSNYFNRKYTRQGNLFQGSYRAVLINSEYHLNIIGVYIHTNPSVKNIIIDKEFSSLYNYKLGKSLPWLNLNKSLLNNVNFKNLGQYKNILNMDEKEKLNLGIF